MDQGIGGRGKLLELVHNGQQIGGDLASVFVRLKAIQFHIVDDDDDDGDHAVELGPGQAVVAAGQS